MDRGRARAPVRRRVASSVLRPSGSLRERRLMGAALSYPTTNAAGRLAALDRGVAEQGAEHRFVVVAVVPLPDPPVQVAGKPLGRDGVVCAANVRLEVPEE